MSRKWTCEDSDAISSLSLVGGQVTLYVKPLDARVKEKKWNGECRIRLPRRSSVDKKETIRATLTESRRVLLAAASEIQRILSDSDDGAKA